MTGRLYFYTMDQKCFVIQPFDSSKFDLRYREILKPAIEKAGLMPYRVDEDYGVRIPVESIENGIRLSSICLAEISTDNPNVWYELGYAIAYKKDVIMICSSQRKKFPFDVQHRSIIRYKTDSPSDIERLSKEITDKIKSYIDYPDFKHQKSKSILEEEFFTGFEIDPMSYGLKITSPNENDSLPNPVHVKGKFLIEPPPGMFYCIEFNPRLDSYWPKNLLHFNRETREWNSKMSMGTEDGKNRIIYVVAVGGSEGKEAIVEYRRSGGNIGLDELTRDMMVIDKKTVILKSG